MKKNNGNAIKRTKGEFAFDVFLYVLFFVLIIVFAYPFYYLLISTISDNSLVSINKIFLYPIGIHFRNYLDVFKLERVYSAALISVGRTVIGTVLAIIVNFYVAYFFTKQNMWGRKVWYRFVIISMYFTAGMIPTYLNIKMLGLLNSFWVYIIPTCFTVYWMILIKTYIESLPPELEESAEIDGAGYLTRMFRIVLPLSKPILATIALFSAVRQWNSIFDTKMYITDTDLYTLQFTLYEYQQQVKSVQDTLTQMGLGNAHLATATSTQSLRLTMTAVTVIPIMCVYPFIQKYYMKGIMLGAVKG